MPTPAEPGLAPPPPPPQQQHQPHPSQLPQQPLPIPQPPLADRPGIRRRHSSHRPRSSRRSPRRSSGRPTIVTGEDPAAGYIQDGGAPGPSADFDDDYDDGEVEEDDEDDSEERRRLLNQHYGLLPMAAPAGMGPASPEDDIEEPMTMPMPPASQSDHSQEMPANFEGRINLATVPALHELMATYELELERSFDVNLHAAIFMSLQPGNRTGDLGMAGPAESSGQTVADPAGSPSAPPQPVLPLGLQPNTQLGAIPSDGLQVGARLQSLLDPTAAWLPSEDDRGLLRRQLELLEQRTHAELGRLQDRLGAQSLRERLGEDQVAREMELDQLGIDQECRAAFRAQTLRRRAAFQRELREREHRHAALQRALLQTHGQWVRNLTSLKDRITEHMDVRSRVLMQSEHQLVVRHLQDFHMMEVRQAQERHLTESEWLWRRSALQTSSLERRQDLISEQTRLLAKTRLAHRTELQKLRLRLQRLKDTEELLLMRRQHAGRRYALRLQQLLAPTSCTAPAVSSAASAGTTGNLNNIAGLAAGSGSLAEDILLNLTEEDDELTLLHQGSSIFVTPSAAAAAGAPASSAGGPEREPPGLSDTAQVCPAAGSPAAAAAKASPAAGAAVGGEQRLMLESELAHLRASELDEELAGFGATADLEFLRRHADDLGFLDSDGSRGSQDDEADSTDCGSGGGDDDEEEGEPGDEAGLGTAVFGDELLARAAGAVPGHPRRRTGSKHQAKRGGGASDSAPGDSLGTQQAVLTEHYRASLAELDAGLKLCSQRRAACEAALQSLEQQLASRTERLLAKQRRQLQCLDRKLARLESRQEQARVAALQELTRAHQESLRELREVQQSELLANRRRHKLESDLREAGHHFLNILDALLHPIVVSDTRGVIQLVNRAAYEVFGYGPQELIGQNVAVLADPAIRVHHDRYVNDYVSGMRSLGAMGQPGRLVSCLTKNGEYLELSISLSECSATGSPGGRLFIALFSQAGGAGFPLSFRAKFSRSPPRTAPAPTGPGAPAAAMATTVAPGAPVVVPGTSPASMPMPVATTAADQAAIAAAVVGTLQQQQQQQMQLQPQPPGPALPVSQSPNGTAPEGRTVVCPFTGAVMPAPPERATPPTLPKGHPMVPAGSSPGQCPGLGSARASPAKGAPADHHGTLHRQQPQPQPQPMVPPASAVQNNISCVAEAATSPAGGSPGLAPRRTEPDLQVARLQRQLRRSRRQNQDLRHRLRASHDVLYLSLDTAFDALIMFDRHGTVCVFSRGAQVLFGLAEDQVLGRPVEVLGQPSLRLVHAGTLERFRRRLLRPLGVGPGQPVCLLPEDVADEDDAGLARLSFAAAGAEDSAGSRSGELVVTLALGAGDRPLATPVRVPGLHPEDEEEDDEAAVAFDYLSGAGDPRMQAGLESVTSGQLSPVHRASGGLVDSSLEPDSSGSGGSAGSASLPRQVRLRTRVSAQCAYFQNTPPLQISAPGALSPPALCPELCSQAPASEKLLRKAAANQLLAQQQQIRLAQQQQAAGELFAARRCPADRQASFHSDSSATAAAMAAGMDPALLLPGPCGDAGDKLPACWYANPEHLLFVVSLRPID